MSCCGGSSRSSRGPSCGQVMQQCGPKCTRKPCFPKVCCPPPCCPDPCIPPPPCPPPPCCPPPIKKLALVVSPPLCPPKCCPPLPCWYFQFHHFRPPDPCACDCKSPGVCSVNCPSPPTIIRPIRSNCCPPPPKMPNQPCPLPCCNPLPPCCVVVKPCQPRCAPSPCCPPPPVCGISCPRPDPRCCPKPLTVSIKCPTTQCPMRRNDPCSDKCPSKPQMSSGCGRSCGGGCS